MNKFNITFKPSTEIKINLSDDQKNQISSADDIKVLVTKENVLAFDIFNNNKLIGFSLLRKYSHQGWFLWNYAIDETCQGQGLGYNSLVKLIDYMKTKYNLREMTTTYLWGNEQAMNLYKKAGFTMTDVIDEPNCHEVNMILSL